MAEATERREMGSSLMFIGLALWVADLLVAFYLPAAAKVGGNASFLSVLAVIAVLGLALMITGYLLRGKAESS